VLAAIYITLLLSVSSTTRVELHLGHENFPFSPYVVSMGFGVSINLGISAGLEGFSVGGAGCVF